MSAAPPSPTNELLHVTVNLHRMTLLDELIAQFKDEAVMSCSVKYSFVDEMGADAEWCVQGCVCCLLYRISRLCCRGCRCEGAVIIPEMARRRMKSVGRILAKGLKDHGYFPFRLAQVLTAAITFGEHSVSPDLLFDSLMLYLSRPERDLLSAALQEAVVGDDQAS